MRKIILSGWFFFFLFNYTLIAPLSAQIIIGPPTAESSGNVDGVLHWELGNLEPSETVRQVAILLYADSPEKAAESLKPVQAELLEKSGKLRNFGETSFSSTNVASTNQNPIWIENKETDFCLFGPCFFRWDDINRQALRGETGGQLSQFTYYLHYDENGTQYNAGVPHYEKAPTENINIVVPVHKTGERELTGIVATENGKLQMQVTAVCPPEGRFIQVDFLIKNSSTETIKNLSLSVYANLEANHSHSSDYTTLDADSKSLFVIDIPTKHTAVLAGSTAPSSGVAGRWNSFDFLKRGTGVPAEQWKSFSDISEETKRNMLIHTGIAQGYYLPYYFDNPLAPPTVNYTQEEAKDLLQADWMRQAMDKPLSERAALEIAWTRELADRIKNSCETSLEETQTPAFDDELAELDRFEKQLYQEATRGIDAALAKSLYFKIREVKRKITFKNPVIDFEKILFIDQPYQTHLEGNHESIHRMGVSATPGGRLLVLTGLGPDGVVEELAPNAEKLLGKAGSFWRPELSFDAEKVLFCYKPAEEKSFKLYEINLDGTNLIRLTNSDYDDIDPIYLPDGKIMFTTTRANSYVRCGPFIYSYVLAKCNADGSDIYLVSYNGEPDFVPALMNDGRVIYSRWEYSDKPLWRVQSLWTTNQDGTNTTTFWGNQSVWPDHTSQPRAIPNSGKIMFVGVGHHDWWSGSVGMIDPKKGANFPFGLTKVTADQAWPECSTPPIDVPESNNYHGAGIFTGYASPYPLSEKDFLVSARAQDGKFRLYLMDVDGNRELIYEGAHNVWHPFPIKPRQAPQEQPDRVIWPGVGEKRAEPQGGTFFSPDIYEGLHGIERGEVKSLRLMQLDYKTYSTWRKTYRNSGPAVSIVQEEGVKRALSVVPVEEDGSVFFDAPAGVSLYFQLLDKDGRCLHTMRSFTGLMPGENRGCIGCHEQQHSTSSHTVGPAAAKRGPTPLSPPVWGTESISFERFVQPVLDKYCVDCHNPEGEAKDSVNLALRPGVNLFKEPYLTLIGSAGWMNPIPDNGQPGYGIADVLPVESMDPSMNDPKALITLDPKQYLSCNSRLVDFCASGTHYGVKVDSESLDRIMLWVDACGPFCGEEEIRAIEDPDFEGIELLPIRPRVKTAPIIPRP